MKKLGRYAWNILVSIDQLGNVLAGGDPDETISSRLGRWKVGAGACAPWYDPREMLVRFLDALDKDHVIEAIERRIEENPKRAVFHCPRR